MNNNINIDANKIVNNLQVKAISPTVDPIVHMGDSAFRRIFKIDYEGQPSISVHTDIVRLKDHRVVDFYFNDKLDVLYGIFVISGVYKVGECVNDINEPIVYTQKNTRTVELLSGGSEGIDVDSNADLLNEIFEDTIAPTYINSNFTESDIIHSQLIGKVQSLENTIKLVCNTLSSMELKMSKLENDNKNLTSLVTQVLNHQVPDEYAKNVLEDIFKKDL